MPGQRVNGDWSGWLCSRVQPVVFAFGGDFGDARTPTLEAMVAELRGLGAVLVVASESAAFCLGPEDEPRPVPALDRDGLEQLRRSLGVDPGARTGRSLSLTLVDESAAVRMQSTCEPETSAAETLLAVVRHAGRTLRSTTGELHTASRRHEPLFFTRREAVVLSLIGAFALPFVESCRSGPSSAPSGPSSRPRTRLRELPLALDELL